MRPSHRANVKQFGNHQHGAAAVEFALIAIPMMVLIFGSIQNLVLSAAKLSLDLSVQNFAYEASNSDANILTANYPRSAFCNKALFNLVDCNSKDEFCFHIFALGSGEALQNPTSGCDNQSEAAIAPACCYQVIVSYQVPPVFDISAFLAIFGGTTGQRRVIQSVGLIYRS